MTIEEIMEIVYLGVLSGGLLTFAPVGIGYAIQLLYKFMHRV